jgi:hypothetical protein
VAFRSALAVYQSWPGVHLKLILLATIINGKRGRVQRGRCEMYVVVQHRFTNTPVALARGEKLIKSEGAPTGAHGLQFYPARDGTGATCLWEASSVQSIQRYVDTTLGDSSVNTCYEVDAAQSFAQQPSGIRESAAIGA